MASAAEAAEALRALAAGWEDTFGSAASAQVRFKVRVRVGVRVRVRPRAREDALGRAASAQVSKGWVRGRGGRVDGVVAAV